MIDTPDDAHLVQACRHNPSAFTQLYQRYFEAVYRYHLARTGCAPEAEDLTSQTFLSALEALPRYQEDGRFAAWLFSIARRKLAEHYRRKPVLALDDLELPSHDPDPLYSLEAQEQQAWLEVQLAALREDERELLRLRFAARLPFEQIGALLGRSTQAAKMAVYRLLERLERAREAENV
jgi:RNA polymerase sigma-70 factor (ECF subfamily)